MESCSALRSVEKWRLVQAMTKAETVSLRSREEEVTVEPPRVSCVSASGVMAPNEW